jgi:peptide/nickel transport system permease protein
MEPLSWLEIFAAMAGRFLPVWVALVVTFALSISFKRRLGLYGKLFDSPVGMIGFGIVMFWVFTASPWTPWRSSPAPRTPCRARL